MKKIAIYTLSLLMLTGCVKESTDTASSDNKVRLNVDPLYSPSPAPTRAAIDKWNNTSVALAYRISPQVLYNDYVGVVVNTNTDQVINTGMEYPSDGSQFHIRGYHPVQAPLSSGDVVYDISKGDQDIMCSNEVSGNTTTPISLGGTNKLKFVHKMTLIHFTLKCAPTQTFPERISGILIGGVKMWGSLNLATGNLSFQIPGNIYVGELGGFAVPTDGEDALQFDAIVQPEVPLTIEVITASGAVTPITAIASLNTTGGTAGMKYTINLVFKGTTIVNGGIAVEPWTTKLSGGAGLNGTTIY